MIKAIGLVVVTGGQASAYYPRHVDIRIVDVDCIVRGDGPECLPIGIGFEELVVEAGIEKYVFFDLQEGQEDEENPKSRWMTDVASGCTLLGYREWVKWQRRNPECEKHPELNYWTPPVIGGAEPPQKEE